MYEATAEQEDGGLDGAEWIDLESHPSASLSCIL